METVTGYTPSGELVTEGQLATAIIQDRQALEEANRRIETIAEIVREFHGDSEL